MGIQGCKLTELSCGVLLKRSVQWAADIDAFLQTAIRLQIDSNLFLERVGSAEAIRTMPEQRIDQNADGNPLQVLLELPECFGTCFRLVDRRIAFRYQID